jgi:hypothetical protein
MNYTQYFSADFLESFDQNSCKAQFIYGICQLEFLDYAARS